NFGDIVGGLGVSTTPHHILGTSGFDQSSTNIVVAAAHRIDYFADRDVVRLKLVGIYVDLILSDKTSERRDFRDTGNGLQVIAKIPVLIAAQIGEALFTARIDQRILENPANPGCIRSQFRFDTLRKPRQDG